jgi:putative hydrolase of the HAD superfamily
MSPVQAVIFDLDDTLCDTTGAMLSALGVLSAQVPAFAVRTPAELHALQRRIMQGLDEQVFSGELNAEQARSRRFALMLSELGDHSTDNKAVALAYRASYRSGFRQLAGAGALIGALRECGLRVGVLTNYLREVQLETLEAIGLLPHLDAVVTVSDAPPKPHPDSYHAACAALKVAPQQAVMVGDNWHNDVAGAVQAGLRAVWYAPKDQIAPADVSHGRLGSYEPLDAAIEVLLS